MALSTCDVPSVDCGVEFCGNSRRRCERSPVVVVLADVLQFEAKIKTVRYVGVQVCSRRLENVGRGCAFSLFTAQVKAEDAAAAEVEYCSLLDVLLMATSGNEADFSDKRWGECDHIPVLR